MLTNAWIVVFLCGATLYTTDATISAWTEPAITGSASGTGTLSVPEDQAIDKTIVTYAATSDKSVTYTLDPAVAPFSLTTAGALTITAALDFETTASYTLAVKATDADGTGVATITVTVTDAYPPTFSSPPTTACILDNSAAGTTLTTVLATDTEAGQTVSHTIAAAGNTNSDFTIGASTGVIEVNTGKTLDKATTPTYTLEIEAADDGGLKATATVTVTIADTCTGNGSATVALSFVALFVALFASLN